MSTYFCDETLGSQGIDLSTDLTDELPTVTANPFSLEEVLLNLLTNARDAIEERRRRDDSLSDGKINVRTGLSRNGSATPLIRLEIEDNGAGISDSVAPKVFDPFFTTKDPDKGTGLGLAICRSILEEFDGNLEFELAPDRNTVVAVYLPASMP